MRERDTAVKFKVFDWDKFSTGSRHLCYFPLVLLTLCQDDFLGMMVVPLSSITSHRAPFTGPLQPDGSKSDILVKGTLTVQLQMLPLDKSKVVDDEQPEDRQATELISPHLADHAVGIIGTSSESHRGCMC